MIEKEISVLNNDELWQAIDFEFHELTSNPCYLKQLIWPQMSLALNKVVECNGGSIM